MASGQSIRAGRAYVELGANDAPLRAALAATASRMRAWGASLAAIGSQIAGFGLAAAVPAALGIKTFADYEQALADLRAATNPTAEEFANMKAKIEEVAAITGTGPAEVAKAFSELVKAGLPVQEAIGGAGLALVQFARVGALDMQAATKALVGGMTVFSRHGVTASRVMNSISAAADASLVSIADITESFSEGGGTLAQFGQNIDDVNAAFALLGRELKIGGEAGTAMKVLFQRLANPVGEVGEGMQALGLTVQDFRDAQGVFLPLPEIIQRIADAAERLDPIARDQALTQLAGARAGMALPVLLKAGAEGFAKLKNQMATALPVEEKFAIMMNTLTGHFFKLLTQAKLAAIAFGEAVAPALRLVAGLLGMVIPNVAAWIKENKGLVTGIFLGTVALTLFGVALIAAGFALSAMGTALGVVSTMLGVFKVLTLVNLGLWATWTALMSAWKVVMVAVNVVAALFNVQLALWNFLLGGSVVATTAWTIATLAAKVAAWLFNAALVVLNGLLSASVLLAAAGTIVIIGTALAIAAAAALALYQTALVLWTTLTNLGSTAGPLGAVKSVFGEWVEIIKEVVGALENDMPKAMNILKAGFALAVAQIQSLWPPLWEFIKGGFLKIAEVVANHFQVEFKNALNIIQREIAIKTSIFGIGDEQKRREIAQFEETTKSSRLAAVDQLDAELAKLKRKFEKDTAGGESDEVKAARTKLEAARAELKAAREEELILPPRAIDTSSLAPQLSQALAGVRAEAVGTFDAALADRLGAKSLDEKQLEVARQIEKNTKKAADRPELAFS